MRSLKQKSFRTSLITSLSLITLGGCVQQTSGIQKEKIVIVNNFQEVYYPIPRTDTVRKDLDCETLGLNTNVTFDLYLFS